MTREQLSEALEYQRDKAPGKLLGNVLVELGFVTDADVASTLAAAVGITFTKLVPDMIQPEALGVLPWPFIEKHNLMPVSVADGRLSIAVENFADVFLIEEIAQRCQLQVTPLAATASNIVQIRQSFASEHQDNPNDVNDQDLGQLITDMSDDDELTIVENQEEDLDDLQVAASDSPVIKLVNHIIKDAVHARASDIHIEPDDNQCCVRYRIDGALRETIQIPPRSVAAVASRVKIMAHMDISERRVPQDGQITVMLEGRTIELRVSTIASRHGEKIVMRVVDEKAAIFQLEKLGFQPNTLATLREVIRLPNGVFLVTGPTGSGKSTTLYASLLDIADRKKNISTIEDPIEHNLSGINQFQINPKAGFHFAQALRALVRQDPDVIMVGEIRDVDTAKLAAEAALTGHMVLATLHTNDAPSAITRLIYMGLEPYQVAAALRAVLAQRLVRRLCPHCKEPAGDHDPRAQAILQQLVGTEHEMQTTYTARGCARCRDTGCAGRTGIYELLRLDDTLLQAITDNAALPQLRRLAMQRGFTSLAHNGLTKVRAGEIALDSLLDVVGCVTECAARADEPSSTTG